jgi:hypothetical protein
MNVQLIPAPTTPLNLRFGVVYAPRVPAPPFSGFEAVGVALDRWKIRAYYDNGVVAEVFSGDTVEVFYRLAQHLRMDVVPR